MSAPARDGAIESHDSGPANLEGHDTRTGLTLRRAWWRSAPGIMAVLFFTLLINIFKLAVPLYIFQLLDRVVSSRSVETLVMLTVIAVVAVLTGSVMEFVRRWLLVKWGAWIERSFGRRLLLVGLKSEAAVRARPSKLVRDLSQLRQFLSSSAAISWLDVIYVPAFVFVVFLISPVISLVCVTAMAVILILGVLNEILSRRSRSEATKATQERADWLAAAERDPELMGSFDIAGNLAKHWEQSSSERLEKNLSTRKVALATGDSMRFVETCQRIASYGLGVWLVLLGNLTIGGVIAAAILGRIASGTFRRAMSSWRDVSSARSAYRRVKARLSDEELDGHVTSSRDAKLPLTIEDVGHRYPAQSRQLFRHIDMKLAPGEMLSIIGPTGSGKSTMARILAGRISPRSGMVRYGDADITRFPPDELADRLGYLSQNAQLFRGTVRENIARFSNEISDNELAATAELVCIHDKIVKLPDGYETRIGDRDNPFSAGECKQIALARVIHKWPDLLVLDDPEAFLDDPGRAALNKALTVCKKKRMIVVVTTQSMDLAQLSDKVIVLKKNGRPTVCQNRDEMSELRLGSKRSKLRVVPTNKQTEREE